LDCIVIKIRENMRVINKSIYLALGVNMDGHLYHQRCGVFEQRDSCGHQTKESISYG